MSRREGEKEGEGAGNRGGGERARERESGKEREGEEKQTDIIVVPSTVSHYFSSSRISQAFQAKTMGAAISPVKEKAFPGIFVVPGTRAPF